MGFFDFFKKPKVKESQKPTSLALQEIPAFLDKKSDEISQNLSSQINQSKIELSEELELLKNNLSILETAQVKNVEIPQRAKQIMEGNRQIYLSKTYALIEKISLPQEPRDIISFIKNFDKELDNFDKTISKSHRILEEFFLEKASAVATNIKKIDKIFKDLIKTIESSHLSKIGEIKEKANSTITKINKFQQGSNQIIEIENEIKEIEKEIKENESKLSRIKQTPEYKKSVEVIESKNKLEMQLHQLTSGFQSRFSEISPALKKYENLSQNKLVKKYLDSPVSAVLEDNSLEILTILHATQTAIIKNEITLKEEKKSRIMNELFNINQEFIKNFLIQRKELIVACEEKVSIINNSQVLRNITELEREINEEKNSLNEKNLNLEKMKKTLESINLENMKSDIASDIKEKLNLEITII